MSFSVRCSSTSTDTKRSNFCVRPASVMQSPLILLRMGMRSKATCETSSAVTRLPCFSMKADRSPLPAPNSRMVSFSITQPSCRYSARPSLTL